MLPTIQYAPSAILSNVKQKEDQSQGTDMIQLEENVSSGYRKKGWKRVLEEEEEEE